MPEELPEEIEIGTIELKPGEPYMYAAWGIRYRFKGGSWRITDMVFGKKSDAIDWMNRNYLKYESMEGEVIPVKRTVWLDEIGNIKTKTEELTE